MSSNDQYLFSTNNNIQSNFPMKRLAFGAGMASAIPLCYYLNDSQSKIYKYMLDAGRYLTGNDAEKAHELGILLAKYSLMPTDRVGNPPILATKVWGITFPNPVGLAAGFDKNGEYCTLTTFTITALL